MINFKKMMQNRKKVIIWIIAIIYISIIGVILPYIVITLELYHRVYNTFEKMALDGLFFFFFIMTTLFFIPFIYSTLVKEKLSFNIKKNNKEGKKPRSYALMLFIIGVPIMIWFFVGIIGYYSISEFSGGLGELAQNGFLVLFIILLYFCIFPAIILSMKKGKPSF